MTHKNKKKKKSGLLIIIALTLIIAFILNESFVMDYKLVRADEAETYQTEKSQVEESQTEESQLKASQTDAFSSDKGQDEKYQLIDDEENSLGEEDQLLDKDNEGNSKKSAEESPEKSPNSKDVDEIIPFEYATSELKAPDEINQNHSLLTSPQNIMVFALNAANPDYRPVGDKTPMTNGADWWSNAKSYIQSTFGVTDGVYNTVASAPPAGSVWCAGLVSRVINATYPGGESIAVTESVATLYDEIQASGKFEFVAEGYVADFVDVIESTQAGDIMLLMSKNSSGGWEWSHSNLITYYGYIYSQGAGGKIRMNTFDNYNQYGAYEASVSAGYYYYIYRPITKTEPDKSYLTLLKKGKITGKSFDDVYFEAYDENGNYLGVYITGYSSDEEGGFAYYLRKSAEDTSYADDDDGSIPLPVGSTVYLYEQGEKTEEGYKLPKNAKSYAGTKGGAWSYVRGPQKEYYLEYTTLAYEDWTRLGAIVIPEDENTFGPLSLKKQTKSEYSLYTQDSTRFSLEGAKYVVANSDNSNVYYMETDSTGTAYVLDSSGKRTDVSGITRIWADTYYCWETKASPGYKIDPNCCESKKKSVNLGTDNPNPTFVSEEVPEVSLKGGIEINKCSSKSFSEDNPNYNLSATYTVYNSSGAVAGTINTDTNGYGYLGGLSAGIYTVKETSAGKGYELDEKSYTVNVTVPAIGTYVYDGVDYSAVFNPDYYRKKYPDLSGLSDADLLKHFATSGLNEGRRASEVYDAGYYAAKKGKSCYEAFKYYLGYGMYLNETAAPMDNYNQKEGGVYSNGTFRPVVLSYEAPKKHDFDCNMFKKDRFTAGFSVQGEAELAGAEFCLKYYAVAADMIDRTDELETMEPDKEWTMITKESDDGSVKTMLKEEYLVDGLSDSSEEVIDGSQSAGGSGNSDIYFDEDGNVFLPFGIISVEETKAPKGYKLSEVDYGTDELDKVKYYVIDENTVLNEISISNTILRGDIKLEKRDYDTDEAMKGVQFEVKSTSTGETLLIETDENGFASTEGLWMSCTADGMELTKADGYGALPFGTYIVTEISCDANQGKQLEPPIEIKVEEEMIYDAFDPNNNEPIIRNVSIPKIGTTAHVKDSDKDTIPTDEIQTLVDTVSYKFLKANTSYSVLGRLMVRDEKGLVSEYKKDGKPVTSVTHFTTQSEYTKSVYEIEGTVDVVFEGIDVSGLEGKSLVVFESLYLGDDIETVLQYPDIETDIFPVKHEDGDDENQTLHVVKIGTKAHAENSDSQTIQADGKITVVDTISYENVTVGEQYSFEGVLYDKNSGEPVLVNGEEVRSKVEFTAEKTSGTVDMKFIFDATDIDGDLVVFERMYDADGKLVAKHEDIESESQTVKLVKKVVESKNEDSDSGKTDDSKNAEQKLSSTIKNTPKTGDSIPLKIVAALVLISLCSVVYILYRKKGS